MTSTRSARLAGTGIFLAGVLLLSLWWLIPYFVSGTIDQCASARGAFYHHEMHVEARCAVAGLLGGFSWIFIIPGVGGMAYGVYALIKANRK